MGMRILQAAVLSLALPVSAAADSDPGLYGARFAGYNPGWAPDDVRKLTEIEAPPARGEAEAEETLEPVLILISDSAFAPARPVGATTPPPSPAQEAAVRGSLFDFVLALLRLF
jgi:hypothetical protein